MRLFDLADEAIVRDKTPVRATNTVRGKPPVRDSKIVGSKVSVRKGFGCSFGPLNEVKGVKKIFGFVSGVSMKKEEYEGPKKEKKIMLWAQSPGPLENKAEKELVGPSGELLWQELEKVGITR